MLNATHFTVVYEFVVSLTLEKVEQEISRNNSRNPSGHWFIGNWL